MTAPSDLAAPADVAALRRQRGSALLAIVLGAVLTLTVGGRTWASVRVEAAAGLPALPQDVTGTDLAGPLPALGLVGLAAVAAVLATRGVARALVGALVVVTGVAVAAYGVDAIRSDPTSADIELGGRVSSVSATAWPWVAVLAGVLLALGGAVVFLRGRRWSALSRRFEAPRDPGAATAPDASTAAVAGHQAHGRSRTATAPVAEHAGTPATERAGTPAAEGAGTAAGEGAGTSAGQGAARPTAPSGGRELWDALDRGEDPTAERP